jgi:transposase-like protein
VAKSLERIRACALRRQGESVKEIAKILGVSRSIASNWTRDIELTQEQRTHLRSRQIAAGHRGRMMGTEANREKKRVCMRIAKEDATADIGTFSKRALFFTGLGLYWGEGVKASNGSTAVSNSDARVIQVMIRWFIECFGIEKERFMPRIFISDIHRDREELLIEYWAKTLDIPRGQFKKTVFLNKGRKIYENRDMYYGVLALRLSKGTNIKYRILAQLDRIAEVSHNAGVVQGLEQDTHKV